MNNRTSPSKTLPSSSFGHHNKLPPIVTSMHTSELLPPSSPSLAFSIANSMFTYVKSTHVTYSFSDVNLLGQCGFGYVHRGILPDGKKLLLNG